MINKNKPDNSTKLHILSFLSLLLGFQEALITYVTSSYLTQITGEGKVGIFYFIGYLASLIVLLQTHHLIKKHGKSKVFFIFLAMKLLALLGVAIFSSSYLGALFIVWVLLSSQLIWTVLDIIIETYSTNTITGSIRGQHLAIMNAGWLFAPFIGAKLVQYGDFSLLFYIGAAITFLVMIISWISLRNVNHNIRRDLKLSQVIYKMAQNKNLSRIYYVALILEIFYAAMVVYTPLYLRDLGYGWATIGEIFTVMLVPFVIVQWPIGILADKKGEKEWLMIAIVIMAVFTAMISFMGKANVISWMFILFMTRVGAAIVEVLRDSFFYRHVKSSDVDLMDFYRTNRSLSYLLVTLVLTVFLIFFGIKWIFLILGLVTMSALWPLEKIKNRTR